MAYLQTAADRFKFLKANLRLLMADFNKLSGAQEMEIFQHSSSTPGQPQHREIRLKTTKDTIRIIVNDEETEITTETEDWSGVPRTPGQKTFTPEDMKSICPHVLAILGDRGYKSVVNRINEECRFDP